VSNQEPLSTLELYHDVMGVIDSYPESLMALVPPELNGYLRQPERLRWMAEMSAAAFDGDICEIGAKVGDTTRVLAEIAQTYDRRVLVVDPWSPGNTGCNPWDYHVFMANTAEYRDRIDVVRASSMSKEAKAALRSRPLCFSYVDGEHSNRAVTSDLAAVGHTAGIVAVDDIFWSKALQLAFLDAADKLWRVPVCRLGSPPMREGYLLPAGAKPRRIKTAAVADRVLEAMRAGTGLSVIRLGDGESRMLAWPEFTERRTPLFESLRYWFGAASFSHEDLDCMADGLRAAVVSADIVGVPDEAHRRQRKEWAEVESYLKMYNLITDSPLANANLHIELFTSNALANILAATDSVTVIGCRDVADYLKSHYGVKDVRWLPVPVEAQMDGFAPTEHWPDRFDELMCGGITVPKPGHLFLVAAGVLGKIYCARVKGLGGVALDLGSVMDIFAGVRSRSYMDNIVCQ